MPSAPARSPRRPSSRATFGGRLGFLIALLLMAAMLPAARAGAAEEEGEGGIPVGEFRLIEPIERSLGGSSWAMAQGLDPRFLAAPVRQPNGGMDYPAPIGAAPAAAGSVAYAQQVPFRSAAPAFSRNQIVTRQLGLFPIQTEPHVAVNPFDPEHLVLGTIDYNFPSMSTYVSFDGGETWDGPNQVRYFREDFTAAGDPVVSFDRDGNVYIAAISLGAEEFRLGGLVSITEVSSMVVSKSTDDGYTWSEAVSAARSTVETQAVQDDTGRERGTVTSAFLDKPWIAVGPSPEDPDRDVIYLTYTEFATSYSVIYADEVPFLTSPATETTIKLVKSEDEGVTWSDPIDVSPTVLQAEGASEESAAGESGATSVENDDGAVPPTQQEVEAEGSDSNQTVQGSQPAVMPDGTLVISYMDTTNDGIQEGLATIMARVSEDGGETFTEEDPQQVGVVRELHFRPRSSAFRYWGAIFPQLAVGPNDEIYIASTALPPGQPTDDGDIYLFRSLDKGQSWEEPVRVNGDDTNRVQFFPSVAVSADGMLHVMWGDMRDDPDEVRYHIYYTRSDDQGETFGFVNTDLGINTPDTRVTDFPSNSLRGFPNGAFIGDYFSIAANEDDVYMVWADTRLGEFGGANQQIGFARQTAIAPPELFLNPASGVAGRDVAIQGFGFQPNSDILVDVGGINVTNVRSNENGEFQINIYMPVTGEGPRNVTAYDETGNIGTASFFTEFGFDSIAREIGELREEVAGSGGAAPQPLPPPPVEEDEAA